MTPEQLRAALAEMKRQQQVADQAASTCAQMIVGRLRHVDAGTLKKLKKELAGFNMTTYRWSEK